MAPKDDRVARTYRAGARIAREQIATGAPEQAAANSKLRRAATKGPSRK